MNVQELWAKLDNGETVYWSSEAYKVYVEPAIPGNDYQRNHHTYRDGKVLTVRCIASYFGCLMGENHFQQLFQLDSAGRVVTP